MNQYQKFYQKTKQERISILKADQRYHEADDIALEDHIAQSMSENNIGLLEIPFGVAPNFLIDGLDVVLPMAIEEPSVVAAASKGAGMFAEAGGFKTISVHREMMGQILFAHINDIHQLEIYLSQHSQKFMENAHRAFPSIIKRGGGIQRFRFRSLEDGYASLDVFVDTRDAMGANMINTMLEAIKEVLIEDGYDPIMGILSNLADQCMVRVEGSIPISNLRNGLQCALRLVDAYELAKRDPYRCATNNKGIMNGVDAFCVATGNDWRAIESCLYSYAAMEGQMKPIVEWFIEEDCLVGVFHAPLPLASVGGSMLAHPKYRLAKKIMREPRAEVMMSYVASLAIAQNFAALYALVTTGIQQGHMRLHQRTMAIVAGATEEEMPVLMQEIKDIKPLNQQSVLEVLEKIRNVK